MINGSPKHCLENPTLAKGDFINKYFPEVKIQTHVRHL
jgi:hypothetical protein